MKCVSVVKMEEWWRGVCCLSVFWSKVCFLFVSSCLFSLSNDILPASPSFSVFRLILSDSLVPEPVSSCRWSVCVCAPCDGAAVRCDDGDG
jgi:hypothetical protein